MTEAARRSAGGDDALDAALRSIAGGAGEPIGALALPVTIELGRTTMYLRELLDLRRGAVVRLDRLASDPVPVFVAGRPVAEGDVVVIDERFGVRITRVADGHGAPPPAR